MSHANAFLTSISNNDLAAIQSELKLEQLRQGDMLAEAGQPIEHVYFMHSGMISIVVPLESGEFIEAGVVGPDDVFGGFGAIGAQIHVNTAMVQVSGSASVASAAAIRKAAANSATFSSALAAHEQFLMAQAQQTAACNARHDIPQRLATWLLRVHDRLNEDELNLTQEFLSQMLGVQRASVTIAACDMQARGLISYKRGKIRITNETGLQQAACECYAAVRDQRKRTIGQMRAPVPASRHEEYAS